jgi:L-amino acid N-acyltransferase YncA
VLRGNPARALYARHGFRVEEESPTAIIMHADPSILSATLRPMNERDWPRVLEIYREGIATGNATLETSLPSYERWDSSHLAACRIVAVAGDDIVGWAALSPVSGRCVYGGVAEVSVYVASTARGAGIGRRLLERLVVESEEAGFWTLQAGILAENVASRALHASCGFREVGVRERLGQLNGVWRDIVLLERRSDCVGV